MSISARCTDEPSESRGAVHVRTAARRTRHDGGSGADRGKAPWRRVRRSGGRRRPCDTSKGATGRPSHAGFTLRRMQGAVKALPGRCGCIRYDGRVNRRVVTESSAQPLARRQPPLDPHRPGEEEPGGTLWPVHDRSAGYVPPAWESLLDVRVRGVAGLRRRAPLTVPLPGLTFRWKHFGRRHGVVRVPVRRVRGVHRPCTDEGRDPGSSLPDLYPARTSPVHRAVHPPHSVRSGTGTRRCGGKSTRAACRRLDPVPSRTRERHDASAASPAAEAMNRRQGCRVPSSPPFSSRARSGCRPSHPCRTESRHA
jgi:hypothetical protein